MLHSTISRLLVSDSEVVDCVFGCTDSDVFVALTSSDTFSIIAMADVCFRPFHLAIIARHGAIPR